MAASSIAVLFGLSFATASASVASCEGYTCPDGWTLRQEPDKLKCSGKTCGSEDKGTCCMKADQDEPTTAATCEAYTCPEGWTLREQPGQLRCLSHTCGAEDKGTCCLTADDGVAVEGVPTTPRPSTNDNDSPCTTQPSTTPDSPCTTQMSPTPAPTPPPTTTPPPKTCVSYNCPSGWHSKDNNALIKCWDRHGCTAKDTPNCCLPNPTRPPTTTQPPTPAPTPPAPTPTTPAPTPAPTPSPPIIPPGCKVTIPDGGFAPWEVYQVMKSAVPKIDTPAKLLMGGQTMNISNVNMRSSQFRCEHTNHELRAVLDTARSDKLFALSIHNSITPRAITTQCLLTQISLYKSCTGNLCIPGLRFDYGSCPFGIARQAAMLVGLRKVTDNWGKTPGLLKFFQGVCGDNKKDEGEIRFDLIDRAQGAACFAASSDYTLMRSDRDCFETSIVFTLMDSSNHFPVFPVKDSEWDMILKMIPKADSTDGGHVTTATGQVSSENPCAPPVPVFPKVYGHIVQDRLCVAIPELGCNDQCGKFCEPVEPFSTQMTSTAPGCQLCYDCEYEEVWYAIWGTILAFFLTNTCYKCMTRSNYYYWQEIRAAMPDMPYSQLTQPARGVQDSTYCVPASLGYLFMSGFFTLMAYMMVSSFNYMIVKLGWMKEMCILVFSWHDVHHHVAFNSLDNGNACRNVVCQWRLAGLVIVTWLSLWALFSYWRWQLVVTAEKMEVKRVEVAIEMGGGSGGFAYGGSSMLACTVQ